MGESGVDAAAAAASSSSSSSSTSSSLSSIMNDKYLLSATIASLFMVFLVILALFDAPWFPLSSFAGKSMQFSFSIPYNNYSINYPKREEHVLKCTSANMTITCPANYPPKSKPNLIFPSSRTCPEYFRWIHEDLKTWKEKGIERHMVESISKRAHFRLVIVNGTAYVKQYMNSPVTRDDLTLWGILQLLKLYPGMLPDLDLMFRWDNKPIILRENYPGERSASAPPLFRYCNDDSALDIVFPDWSFWGWPEINVRPWVQLVEEFKEGNSMKKWTDRKPYAFWRGNVYNGIRKRLADCASIEEWNAKIIHQGWLKESRAQFKHSKLSKQCVHRYKIYIEGDAWSVSEKYILACDSMTLLVDPIYYDFFTRSLIPMKHYWPINPNNLCKSIKFAVNWGNNNTNKAQEIGKDGSDYIFEQVKMENVYDYMFHVLNEYGKLLKYKPTVPDGAVELCSENFGCYSPANRETEYKIESMVNEPAEQGPCNLPPPYTTNTLQTLRDQKAKIREAVQMWENGYG